MITKAEYFITKKRLAKREEALFTQLNSNERNWKEFCALPVEMQNKMRHEWDAYYQAVRKSPVHQLLEEYSRHFAVAGQVSDSNTAEWKEKARVATAQSQIPKPSGFDPLYAEYKAQEHMMFVNDTKAMRKTVDEYRDVYETPQRGAGSM